MAAKASTLLSLPPELILDIAEHLPADGVLAFKLSHRTLNSTLPLGSLLRNTVISKCARQAMHNHLSPPGLKDSRMRCIFCKKIYPVTLFNSSQSHECIPSVSDNGNSPGVIDIPQHLCSWHVSGLVKVVRTEPGGRNEWTSRIREMCMHCGHITAWEACNCRCDSCAVRRVRTYTRYLNNQREYQDYRFWRDANLVGQDPTERAIGRLFVRETCRNPSTRSASVINFPVYYEDLDPSPTEQPPKPRVVPNRLQHRQLPDCVTQ